MQSAELLRTSLVNIEADVRFTEAVLTLRDGSRLCFCHRVGERWAKAIGTGPQDQQDLNDHGQCDDGIAGQLLAAITMFRLNAKHLDIQFQDGSRWDEPVQAQPPGNSARKSAGLS